MGLIGFYIAQGYKIAYMAILGPFWPVGILPKRYNEVILKLSHNMLKLHSALNGGITTTTTITTTISRTRTTLARERP